jgi:hypothetical protein
VAANAGFVSVGITSDTAEFAVEAIRSWLGRMGPFAELRTRCRVRPATLYQRLVVLTSAGRVVKCDDDYGIARG